MVEGNDGAIVVIIIGILAFVGIVLIYRKKP